MKLRSGSVAQKLLIAAGFAASFGFSVRQASGPDASEILKKTLSTYTGAKSYQATWTYTLERGAASQKMTMEIKARGTSHLAVHVGPKEAQKPQPGVDPIPEIRITVDGKTAWFENTSEKVYYKVPLPKNAQISPLLFFPQMPTSSGVTRLDDLKADGKTIYVLQALTNAGATSRMEIESGTFRITRFVSESALGLVKNLSTFTADKETFDADVPDSQFSYKPPRGAKEIPAPPDAAALFGPADK